MIQILGIRRFQKEGKTKAYDAFFDRKWRAPNVPNLFENIEQYLKEIPKKEHVNLYYTCAQCLEEKGRKMIRQEVMPFDVDGIDRARRKEYVEPVCKALGVEPSQTGILFTGNGLQFIVGIKESFQDTQFFDNNRIYYKAILRKINTALSEYKLPGEADATVFSAARIMRLPLTWNDKTWKGGDRIVGELYHRKIIPIEFNLQERSGIPRVGGSDQISTETLKSHPPADNRTILKECEFLKHCQAHAERVSEAQWYAMLSISGRMENGTQLSHSLSEPHPNYSFSETEEKLEQAIAASGPRTCQNIGALWDGCRRCKHIDKIKSPILITGKNFIQTKDKGFHIITVDQNGNPKQGKPCYEDLRRYFDQQQQYKTVDESESCFTWGKTHWSEVADSRVKYFAQKHFKPPADNKMCSEFVGLVQRTNLTTPNWFIDSTHRKINFKNGYLNLDTMDFKPHDSGIGFRYVLPYEYNPLAKAPRFESFLLELMCEDKELAETVMEFMGYSLSNDECWLDKALILVGYGRNGKSTFMHVLRKLVGRENYSSLSMSDLQRDTGRYQLDGRLFNLCEEAPTKRFMNSEIFKNLITGGEHLIKQLYKQPYSIENRAKFLFSCNELPPSDDTSEGFFRRLLIVPFIKVFEGKTEKTGIKYDLFEELPGIFNLCIYHYRNLKARQRFKENKVIANQIHSYKRELDTVAAWFEDNVTIAPDVKKEIVLSDLYLRYRVYAETRGTLLGEIKNIAVFGKRVRKLLGNDYNSSRKILNGTRETVLRGIEVQAEEEEDF